MARVRLGVEMLLDGEQTCLNGKRVGLVTSYAMTDSQFRPVIDRMQAATSFKLVRLLGPEHGVRGCAREGEHVLHGRDEHTGLQAFSLYGRAKRPTAEMLAGLDALVIDLQDIGTRYYTNMGTLYYCMEACKEAGLTCVVLDRPNPLGGVVTEGRILDPAFRSFVGMFALPNRHGLTMGELATAFAQTLGAERLLHVVRMAHWERSMLWPDTGLPFVSPSPNTSGFAMMLLYPGTCLFEGLDVSLGRGTTRPFEVIGAPTLDGHKLAERFNEQAFTGVVARPIYFTPVASVHAGQVCQGVQLHLTDVLHYRALPPALYLLQEIVQMRPEIAITGEGPGEKPFLDLLAGTDLLRKWLRGEVTESYLSDEESQLRDFARQAESWKLYS